MTFSEKGGRLMPTVDKLANLYLLMIHGHLLLAVLVECWGAVVLVKLWLCWRGRAESDCVLWLLEQGEWQLLKLEIMEGQMLLGGKLYGNRNL